MPSVQNDVNLAVSEQATDPDFVSLMRAEGERITKVRFIDGNKIELLRNGADAYPAMLAAIAVAHRHRIDMESYEFDDGAGTMFAEALIKARKRGIKINLIYDASEGIARIRPLNC